MLRGVGEWIAGGRGEGRLPSRRSERTVEKELSFPGERGFFGCIGRRQQGF